MLNTNNLIKYISIFIALLLSIFFFYFSKHIKLDASSDTLILQNDENFKYYNYYNQIFPNKNFLVLAIKSDNLIDQNYINTINNIKQNLLKIDSIESIFSILDAPILISTKLKLLDLNSNYIPTIKDNVVDLNLALNEISSSPIFKEQIISKNKKISALIIYPKINSKFNDLKKEKDYVYNLLNKDNSQKNINKFKIINHQYKIQKKIFNENRHNLILNIRKNIDQFQTPYEFFLGGIDMIADDTISYVKKDILIFSITVTFFLIFVLFIIFRSIKWVLIPLITTMYAILSMVGLLGFLNWEITAISSNFISLMLILSISMNIHIINRYRINFQKKISSKNLSLTMQNMFYPCLYTVLTTVVAFGSLLFSDIKPVIDFGKIMIVALLIIFFTSFTILPLTISFFPKIYDNHKINWQITNHLFKFSHKHKFKIFLTNIIFFIICIWGMTKLDVENSFINYFKNDTEIYKGMKLIDQELGGTTPIDIIIKFKDFNPNNQSLDIADSKEETVELELEIEDDLFESDQSNQTGWFNSEKIATIKSVHHYLESRSEIGKVQSLYSLIQLANMINQQPLDPFELSIIYNKIPDDFKNLLIAPYLSIEKNMIKISARVKDSENIKRNVLIKEIVNDLSDKFENVENIKVNGLLVLYNNMLQSLFSSQIKSFGFVLILIFIMFIFLFKSFKLSCAGIIPNIFASTFILGLIGILGISLDIMTITIAAITIGIAVDNSIHYLYNFKKGLSNQISTYKSLENSHKTVGQAVLTTSITIAFGFSVLCLSNFIPTILFGFFTAIAMIVAMLGVLVTLPSILSFIKQ